MKHLEIDACHRANLVIAMSDHDCTQIQKMAPSVAVLVIPNGVDIESLSPTTEGGQPRIIFTGWMRHLPNLDAVEWFIKDVWPLIRQNHPSVRFSIVGKGFPHALLSLARRDERIDYLGFVEDITSVVGKAWVPVVPLRIGSGTRLKLLKPMALGTPVATNTIAYEGVDATPELHLLLGDSSQDLAGVTLKLLRDHELRRQVANAARKLVKCKYSWLAVGKAAVASVHGTAAKEQKME